MVIITGFKTICMSCSFALKIHRPSVFPLWPRAKTELRILITGGQRRAIAFHTPAPYPVPYPCSIPSERVRNGHGASPPLVKRHAAICSEGGGGAQVALAAMRGHVLAGAAVLVLPGGAGGFLAGARGTGGTCAPGAATLQPRVLV